MTHYSKKKGPKRKKTNHASFKQNKQASSANLKDSQKNHNGYSFNEKPKTDPLAIQLFDKIKETLAQKAKELEQQNLVSQQKVLRTGQYDHVQRSFLLKIPMDSILKEETVTNTLNALSLLIKQSRRAKDGETQSHASQPQTTTPLITQNIIKKLDTLHSEFQSALLPLYYLEHNKKRLIRFTFNRKMNLFSKWKKMRAFELDQALFDLTHVLNYAGVYLCELAKAKSPSTHNEAVLEAVEQLMNTLFYSKLLYTKLWNQNEFSFKQANTSLSELSHRNYIILCRATHYWYTYYAYLNQSTPQDCQEANKKINQLSLLGLHLTTQLKESKTVQGDSKETPETFEAYRKYQPNFSVLASFYSERLHKAQFVNNPNIELLNRYIEELERLLPIIQSEEKHFYNKLSDSETYRRIFFENLTGIENYHFHFRHIFINEVSFNFEHMLELIDEQFGLDDDKVAKPLMKLMDLRTQYFKSMHSIFDEMEKHLNQEYVKLTQDKTNSKHAQLNVYSNYLSLIQHQRKGHADRDNIFIRASEALQKQSSDEEQTNHDNITLLTGNNTSTNTEHKASNSGLTTTSAGQNAASSQSPSFNKDNQEAQKTGLSHETETTSTADQKPNTNVKNARSSTNPNHAVAIAKAARAALKQKKKADKAERDKKRIQKQYLKKSQTNKQPPKEREFQGVIYKLVKNKANAASRVYAAISEDLKTALIHQGFAKVMDFFKAPYFAQGKTGAEGIHLLSRSKTETYARSHDTHGAKFLGANNGDVRLLTKQQQDEEGNIYLWFNRARNHNGNNPLNDTKSHKRA